MIKASIDGDQVLPPAGLLARAGIRAAASIRVDADFLIFVFERSVR